MGLKRAGVGPEMSLGGGAPLSGHNVTVIFSLYPARGNRMGFDLKMVASQFPRLHRQVGAPIAAF